MTGLRAPLSARPESVRRGVRHARRPSGRGDARRRRDDVSREYAPRMTDDACSHREARGGVQPVRRDGPDVRFLRRSSGPAASPACAPRRRWPANAASVRARRAGAAPVVAAHRRSRCCASRARSTSSMAPGRTWSSRSGRWVPWSWTRGRAGPGRVRECRRPAAQRRRRSALSSTRTSIRTTRAPTSCWPHPAPASARASGDGRLRAAGTARDHRARARPGHG